MKEIPLTKGYVAIVDDEDFERLACYKWHVCVVKPHRPYARRRCHKTRNLVSMHREILDAPDGFDVDHVNRRTLDNRRTNIRIATRAQNRANSGPNSNNQTGYKGVRFIEGQKKPFVAFIRDGKYKHLGCFVNASAAAVVYDRAARSLWGEFAYLNFPENFF